MTKRKPERRPDARFGKINYVGPKPSENYDWDDAIRRLKKIFENLEK